MQQCNGAACCLGGDPCLALQEDWKKLQQQSIGEATGTGGEGTLLLRVIANSAERFPVAQAADLAADLLKVRVSAATWCLHSSRLPAPC